MAGPDPATITIRHYPANETLHKICGATSKAGGYFASAQRNGAVVNFFTGDDVVKAAQMYNIAAMILFGEFVGELNDVPKPPPGLIKRVEERCKTKMGNQLLAAQTCDYFFTSDSGDVVHG
jgi:hypothetical protein